MKIALVGPLVAPADSERRGDRAALTAALQMIASTGITKVTIAAHDPERTHADFGLPAVRHVFDGDAWLGEEAREARLRSVVDAARGRTTELSFEDPVFGLIDAIAGADGLVIVAGAVTGSLQPSTIYEYAALTELAELFSKPIFMSAQALTGPLTDRHRQLLAETLERCALLGLGNKESCALARELMSDSSRLRDTVDDTLFVGDAAACAQDAPYCAVAIDDPWTTAGDDFMAVEFAPFLDHIITRTDLDVLLVPSHLSGDVPNGSDSHQPLRDRLLVQSEQAGRIRFSASSGAFRETAGIVRGASMVVSTLCEPLAFAISASVPAIGIYSDLPTGLHMRGLLRAAGQGQFALPDVSVASGHASIAVDFLWQNRGRLATARDARKANLEQRSRAWWQEVAAILSGDATPPAVVGAYPPEDPFPPELDHALSALSDWQHGLWNAMATRELDRLNLRERTEFNDREVLNLERRFAESQAEIADLEYRLTLRGAALSAAQVLASQVADPLYGELLRPATGLLAHRDFEPQIAAIMTSRTFRWTRRALDAYGALGAFARRVVRAPGR